MRRQTPSRQNGRYNEEKDKKSNRKNNRKANADVIEDSQEIKDAKALNQYDDSGVLIKVKPITQAEPTAHEKVEANRPKPVPNFHQKQMAFAPSRSYLPEKKEKDE